jgi:hypothetical protein
MLHQKCRVCKMLHKKYRVYNMTFLKMSCLQNAMSTKCRVCNTSFSKMSAICRVCNLNANNLYVATETWHQNRDLLQLCDATPGGEAALDGAGDGAGLPGHGGSVVQHDRALRLEAATSGSVPGVRSGNGGWSRFFGISLGRNLLAKLNSVK